MKFYKHPEILKGCNLRVGKAIWARTIQFFPNMYKIKMPMLFIHVHPWTYCTYQGLTEIFLYKPMLLLT